MCRIVWMCAWCGRVSSASEPTHPHAPRAVASPMRVPARRMSGQPITQHPITPCRASAEMEAASPCSSSSTAAAETSREGSGYAASLPPHWPPE